MKTPRPLCILVLIATAFPSRASAAKSPFSEFSTKLKRQMIEGKIKSLAVADFADAGGKPVPEGIYFADLLHLYLGEAPNRINLVSRDLLAYELERHNLSTADFESEEALRLFRDSIPAEAVAFGTVDATPQQILLRVLVRRISDQVLVADQQIAIQQSEFFRS